MLANGYWLMLQVCEQPSMSLREGRNKLRLGTSTCMTHAAQHTGPGGVVGGGGVPPPPWLVRGKAGQQPTARLATSAAHGLRRRR